MPLAQPEKPAERSASPTTDSERSRKNYGTFRNQPQGQRGAEPFHAMRGAPAGPPGHAKREPDVLAQNPQPPAGPAAAAETHEIVRLRGEEVPQGGGRVPDSDIEVKVHKNVVVGEKVDGVLQRDEDGKVKALPVGIQLEAQSPDASKLHWVQFYKESEYDERGNAIHGGSSAKENNGDKVYHENDKWHVDAPLPPRQGPLDPKSVHYDHPPNDHATTRTKTSLSMFDDPFNRSVSPRTRAKEVEFKTYLVDEKGPRWETSWKLVTRIDAQDNAEEEITDIRGRPVDRFAAPLETKTWNVGNRIDPLVGDPEHGKVSRTTEQLPNPHFKQ